MYIVCGFAVFGVLVYAAEVWCGFCVVVFDYYDSWFFVVIVFVCCLSASMLLLWFCIWLFCVVICSDLVLDM